MSEKVKKAKGPIRFEAIIPFAIVILAISFYFKLFFDTHLKWAIETAGYHANGSEVNVEDINTSFWKLSFELVGLQVSDSKKPIKNIVEIERIHAQLLWDALLRFKFVIDDSGITGIKTYSDRKKVAKVKPIATSTSEGPSAATIAAQKGLDEVQKKSEGTALGDIAKVAGGADIGSQLTGIESNLKSKAEIERLTKEIQEKEKEYKTKIDSLPKTEEINQLKSRIQAVKINTGNIQEIQKSIQEIDRIAKEAAPKVAAVQNLTNELKSDIEKYSSAIQKIDELIKEDQKALQSRLNVPSLDAKDLATQLFAGQIISQLREVEKYMRMAREHMPAKKSKEQKESDKIKPHERGKGVNYAFGRPNSYPLFWLKKASISSEASDKNSNGTASGTLTNVTSHPPIVGQPMILDVSGSFPEQKIEKGQLKLVVDHVTEIERESLLLKVSGYPVEGRMLSEAENAKLGFNQAKGNSSLDIQLENESVKMTLANQVRDIEYVADSNNEHVRDVLKGIVADIPMVTLDASVSGTWSDLRLNIESNLGRALQDGFTKQLQAKLAQAQAKINEFIENNIGKQKRELTQKWDEFRSKTTGAADKKKEEVSSVQNTANQKSNDAQKQGQKQAEDKAKQEVQKGLEQLKKGGFKF